MAAASLCACVASGVHAVGCIDVVPLVGARSWSCALCGTTASRSPRARSRRCTGGALLSSCTRGGPSHRARASPQSPLSRSAPVVAVARRRARSLVLPAAVDARLASRPSRRRRRSDASQARSQQRLLAAAAHVPLHALHHPLLRTPKPQLQTATVTATQPPPQTASAATAATAATAMATAATATVAAVAWTRLTMLSRGASACSHWRGKTPFSRSACRPRHSCTRRGSAVHY